MRQVVLDTETTGLEVAQGHRVIEIGVVELLDRRLTGNSFQRYLNPEREIDAEALEITGITSQFLEDKPAFADVAAEFLDFIRDAEVIIHNAEFDAGFLDNELKLADPSLGRLQDYCQITDTLRMARQLHPGQRNSLDALCKRYEIDNSHRDLHGALLDAEILTQVYLAMTGGQTALGLSLREPRSVNSASLQQQGTAERPPVTVLHADQEELDQHRRRLQAIDDKAEQGCFWLTQG